MVEVDGLIRVELRGGPAGLTEAQRRVEVPVADERVKVEHLGGYEHFERDAHEDGVYRWTYRTRIAE